MVPDSEVSWPNVARIKDGTADSWEDGQVATFDLAAKSFRPGSGGGGGVPGYTQLELSYNGNGPFLADCIVGEDYDPTVGTAYGSILASIDQSYIFGGDPPQTSLPVIIETDGSGNIIYLSLLYEGYVYAFNGSGEPVGVGLVGPVNSQVWIDSSGDIVFQVGSYTWELQAADGRLSFPAGNSIYTATTLAGLSDLGSAGDFALVVNEGNPFLAVNLQGSWFQVAPPLDVGSVNTNVQNLTQEVTYCSVDSAPWSADYPGLVSHVSPQGVDFAPLCPCAPGDQIQALFNGSGVLFGLPDTIDILGTLTIWDQTGTNSLQATFSQTGVGAESGPLTLTSVSIVGTDLTISEDLSYVTTAAGGAYNVLLKIQTNWD